MKWNETNWKPKGRDELDHQASNPGNDIPPFISKNIYVVDRNLLNCKVNISVVKKKTYWNKW